MAELRLQQALNAGEISPELYGEVSLQKYGSAATTLRNAVVNYRGGAFSRGGSACVGQSKQTTGGSGPPWIIPFQFSITQGYLLEFGDNYLRFIFQGGYVLESGKTISGSSQANPCVITATAHGFSTGDWVFITGVAGMTQLNGNTYIVGTTTANTFSITDLNGNAINSTGYTAYTSGGTAYRIYTISTAVSTGGTLGYQAVDLPYLKYAQSADVMSLTCSNPVTGTEYPPRDLTRLSNTSWTLVDTNYDEAITAPVNITATANSQAPTAGINATFSYVVTAVDSKGNESVTSAAATCHGADIEVEGGTNVITWKSVSGALTYNIYRAPPSVDTGTGGSATQNPVPPGSIYGLVGSSYGNQFADTSSTADLSVTPPIHFNPFARGQILSLTITNIGYSLTTVTWSITTSTGSQFYGYPVVVGGGLGAFPIVNQGKNYQASDSVAFNGAGYATGTIDFTASGNPSNGDTITLGGVVWTFVTSLSGSTQTLIQGSVTQTIALLVQNLNASANATIGECNYSADTTGKILVITFATAGTAGNAFTIAASAATASGTHLTGGAGSGGGAPAATLNVGPESGTYPGVVAYFQERRFYANSLNNPDTFWTSQTARYNNFDQHLPSQATDAITASPWTEQVNGVQWLVAMPGGLIAMTGQRAWQIIGAGSYALNAQPITSSTTEAQPQAFNGCSPTIQPVVVDFDVIYVGAIGNNYWYDLSWNFWTNIYTGSDLTILSGQLFQNHQMISRAWCRNPYKVLWCVREDGVLLSFTFMKQQEVYGWARHDTRGYYQCVAAVTEPPVDALYAVVLRYTGNNPNGAYFIERFDNRLWTTVEDAYAVDCAASNPMTFPACNIQASAASGPGVTFSAVASVFTAGSVGSIIRYNGGIATITGYTNGFQVTGTWNVSPTLTQITANPTAFSGAWSIAAPVTSLHAPQFANTTGLVGLLDGVAVSNLSGDALGNIALPFTASDVKVGWGYTVQIQTPYLNNPKEQGARKVIPAVTFRLSQSATGFQTGTNQPDAPAQNPPQLFLSWTALETADTTMGTGGQQGASTYTSPGGQTVTNLWTGDIRIGGAGADWESKGQVAIQQANPVAIEILAVMPEILPGDIPEVTYEARSQDQRAQGGVPSRRLLG